MAKWIGCLFLLFISLPHLFAESDPTGVLSLNLALETALKNNPEIIAAKKRWDSFRSKIKFEKALEKPQIGYESMYSGDEKNFTVSQEFPFFGKLRLKGKIAANEARMAEQFYRGKTAEVLAKVKTAYAAFLLAQRSIDLLEDNVNLMRAFSKSAESKYATGKVSQADVFKAQIELTKMLNMLITMRQEKETMQAMLNSLLNQPLDHPLNIPNETGMTKINLSFESLVETALKGRPELAEATHHVHHASAILRASRLEYLPDMMAQYRYRTSMTPGMDKTQDIMVGVTVPLWFWKQNAMVESAKFEKEMAEAEYGAMKNMTLFEIKDIFVKAQTAERLIELYETSVIPQAESALKVTQSAYQSDKISFLELIDVQRNLLQFRLEYYQYLAEYEKRKAELDRLIGIESAEERL